ncbi:hypothetical protein BC829DRAFT_414960 [Chytridium lagenaria]|nr:hypothetical protein BC829DRAFT_414960 [Chytridium lagenaria]
MANNQDVDAVASASSVWGDAFNTAEPQPRSAFGGAEKDAPVTSGTRNSTLKETTPLLSNTHDVSNGEGILFKMRSTMSNAVNGSRNHMESEFGPGWRQIVEAANTQRDTSMSWLREQWRNIRTAFGDGWEYILDAWDSLFGHIERNHTVEEKNVACVGVGVAVFLLFLWLYSAFLIFNPMHEDTKLPAPLPRRPRPPQIIRPSPSPPVSLPEPAFLCTSKDCIFAASTILQSIETKFDPCGDFYEFSCGGFKKSHPVTDSSLSMLSLLQEKADAALKNILESGKLSPTSDEDIELLGKVRSFYSSCLDSSAINRRGLQPLTLLLWNRFSKEFPVVVPTFPAGKATVKKERLVSTLVQSHSFGSATLFKFHVDVSTASAFRHVPTLTPMGHLGLAKEDYNDTATISTYKSVATSILSAVVGSNPFFTVKRPFDIIASDVVEFEKRLAEITPSWMDLVRSRNDTISLDDLKIASPVNLMGCILETTATDVFEAYTLWRAILDLGSFAPRKVLDLATPLFSRLNGLRGVSGDRTATCKALTQEFLGDVISKFFAENTVSAKTKNLATDTIEEVRSELRKSLNTYLYLDHFSLPEAFTKVDGISVSAGWQETSSAIREVVEEKNLELISLPVQRSEMTPHAYAFDLQSRLNIRLNTLFVPAASLQFPVFSSGLPSYVNYGATGSKIGSELFHAIDRMGRYYDSNSIDNDWWSEDGTKSFDRASECYVDQYAGHSIELPNGTTKAVDGSLARFFGISDHQGLELAFAAWKSSRNTVGGGGSNPLLPGLEAYTSEQLFFISYAMGQCSNLKAEDLTKMVESRIQLPPQIRVNGAVSNSKAFGKAFKCWRDSPMNPGDKCSLHRAISR